MTITTMASQGQRFKAIFCQPVLTMNTSKRNSLLKLTIDMLYQESTQKDTPKMRLLFGFFKSVCLSAEVVKQISQLRLIDEL